MGKNNETQWLILWSRPQDDTWLYYIPNKLFSTEKALLKYLTEKVFDKEDDFKILGRF